MHFKTKPMHRHSIGEFFAKKWSNTKRYVYSFGRNIYNREHNEILGRDGKRWYKLAAFYFFFYITLGGFYCLYLSLYMCYLPLNQPRYVGVKSRFTYRSTPYSPGISIRPRTTFRRNDNLAFINLALNDSSNQNIPINYKIKSYIKNLDEYLEYNSNIPNKNNFSIINVGNCHSDKQYGYVIGQPCILLKINKIISFIPKVGRTHADNQQHEACVGISNIPVRCMGEYPTDEDMLGPITYYSESGTSDVCGSIDVKHFPYNGTNEYYRPPYVWAQFMNLTPNVLISVECRIFGANIFYDKPAQRASIRFQFYLDKTN